MNKHINKIQALNFAFAAKEQKLLDEIAGLKQLEFEVSAQLVAFQQQAEKEKIEQERSHFEREEALSLQLSQTRQELDAVLRTQDQLEKEFGEQLLRVRQDAEKDRAEQARIHAERAQAEKALNQEIAGLQSEIQALSHAQQLQALQHGLELTTKQDELNRLIQTCADLEAQLKAQILSEQQTSLQLRQKIAEVEKNLAITHASLSWRMTAPLRKMASFIAPRKGFGHSSSSVEQVEPPPVIEATVPESQSTKVQQTSPAAMELIMPHPAQTINLNTPAIASTLDELLACHDQVFIHCAYQTLLGRDPDAEGLNYYLVRLRTGIPKIRILGDLRRSEEGKAYAADLPRLNAAIRRYRWAHKAIIGWLVRLFVRVEGNNATERKLRALESQLFLLGEENHRRFDQMEKALTGLHQLLAEGSTAQAEPDITAPPPPIQPSEPEVLKQLSPRARDIYFQLKNAAASHAERSA